MTRELKLVGGETSLDINHHQSKKSRLFELKDKLRDLQHYNNSKSPDEFMEFVSTSYERETMASKAHKTQQVMMGTELTTLKARHYKALLQQEGRITEYHFSSIPLFTLFLFHTIFCY